jgi:hypothetical protein
LPFTALLANADAAAFNLLRSRWFIPVTITLGSVIALRIPALGGTKIKKTK